jgi:hypothetical protein
VHAAAAAAGAAAGLQGQEDNKGPVWLDMWMLLQAYLADQLLQEVRGRNLALQNQGPGLLQQLEKVRHAVELRLVDKVLL